MKSRKTYIDLFKSAELCDSDNNCTWINHEGNSYLIIPHYSVYGSEALQAFLHYHGIKPLENSLVDDCATLSEADTHKLAAILEKEKSSWADFRVMISGTFQLIQASGYYCIEKFDYNKITYIFSLEAGIELLKSVHSPKAFIKNSGSNCELLLENLIKLNKLERKQTFVKFRDALDKYKNQRMITSAFLSMMPPEILPNESVMQDERLMVRLEPEIAATLMPLLRILNVEFIDHICCIPVSNFNDTSILATTQQQLIICQKRSAKLFQLTQIARKLGGHDTLFHEDEFTLVFRSTQQASFFSATCCKSGLTVTASKNQITCEYETVFNTSEAILKQISAITPHLSGQPSSNDTIISAQTDILAALHLDSIEKLESAIAKHTIDINKPLITEPFAGTTLVTLAATHGSRAILKWLIEHGAEFEAPAKHGLHEGMTPLYAAAHMGQLASVQYLIECKADLDSPLKAKIARSPHHTSGKPNPHAGKRPIVAAVAAGHTEVVECMIQHGADIYAPTETGQSKKMTLLQTAIIHQHKDIVKLLLRHNVNHLESNSSDDAGKLAESVLSRNPDSTSAKEIVNLLQLENLRMAKILAKFIESPIIKDTVGYQWIGKNGRTYFLIPATPDLIPLLITFLENHDIPTTEFGQIACLCIEKSNAEKVLAILDQDKRAWSDYIRILMKIDECVGLSTGISHRQVNIHNLVMDLSPPCQSSILALLSKPFVRHIDSTFFEVTLKGLIMMPPAERIKLLVSFEQYIQRCQKRNHSVTAFIEALRSGVSVEPRHGMKNNHLLIEFNHRHAAIIKPLMIDLEADIVENIYIVPLSVFNEQRVINPEEIITLCKTRMRRMDQLITLSAKFGKRSVTYQEKTLTLKFTDDNDANHFKSVFSDTVIRDTTTFDYEDIFELNDNFLKRIDTSIEEQRSRQAHHDYCKARLKTALVRLIPFDGSWAEEDKQLITDELKPQTAALIHSLGFAGLSLTGETRCIAKVNLVVLAKLTKESFDEIERSATEALDKLNLILDMLCKVKAGKLKYTTEGIIIIFKDEHHKAQFNTCCGDFINEDAVPNSARLVSYQKFLSLNMAELKGRHERLSNRLLPPVVVATPVVHSGRLQSAPTVIHQPAPVATQTKKLKKRKKPIKTVTATTTPNQVKPQEQQKGTRIAQQPFRDHSILDKSAGGSCIDPKITLKAVDVLTPSAPTTPAAPRRPKPASISLLSACLFSRQQSVDHSQICCDIFINLRACIEIDDNPTSSADARFSNNIAMESCIVQLGELYKDMKHSNELSPALIKFMKACRDSTQRTASNTDVTMLDPFPTDHILMLAQNGAELWDLFNNRGTLQSIHK